MQFNQEESLLAPEKKAIITAVILFFNLILISTQIILKNQKSLLINIVSGVASPFQKGFRGISDSVSRELHRYIFLKGIYGKYQDQKKKNILIRQENYFLRRQLQGMKVHQQAEQKFPNFVLVNTISVDINFPFNMLWIDQGRKDGIRENLMVLNLDGELVGKTVPPVLSSSASVRLITSPIGGAGAYIEKNMFEGFVTGSNSPNCLFKYLLENKPVQVGDRVVTSGNDLIFPSFIPIGRITKVEKDYLAQKVTIRPFFLDKPIKYLLVLKK